MVLNKYILYYPGNKYKSFCNYTYQAKNLDIDNSNSTSSKSQVEAGERRESCGGKALRSAVGLAQTLSEESSDAGFAFPSGDPPCSVSVGVACVLWIGSPVV